MKYNLYHQARGLLLLKLAELAQLYELDDAKQFHGAKILVLIIIIVRVDV